MPKITIDGKQLEARGGVPVLRAALEAGFDVPHYCYHPGLSIVASCRLCLMEQKSKNNKTGEMEWTGKLIPSCQTPVADGMEVRFDSDAVQGNQKHVMEYYLLNHPLDCPVCDKAGECYLQDYTEDYGPAASRMLEEKVKNPKKDIGPHTLLYQDRCVLCTRCVRFAQEVAGDGELCVVNRGNRGEIDVFPGEPLDNALQGNVVDLCPVGALLDKDFLFKQRVWLLKSQPSVCPGCSRGCTILVDENENELHRLRPRYNEKVNEWWMCDEGRFGWKYVHSIGRLKGCSQKMNGSWEAVRWEALPEVLTEGFAAAAGIDGGARVACVLSPMMSCEEAWLLASYMRKVAPQCTLVTGYVPVVGKDQMFPKGFVIKAEKAPNRLGIEKIAKNMGGATGTFEEFLKTAQAGKFAAAYVVGGYGTSWVTPEMASAISRIGFVVTHDLFASALDNSATVQIAGCSWVEREGSFVNCDGILQAFERSLSPLDGLKQDGQFFSELAGTGLYRARRVREKMAASMPEFAEPFVPQKEPEFAH